MTVAAMLECSGWGLINGRFGPVRDPSGHFGARRDLAESGRTTVSALLRI